jgi:hypothetical protein
MKLGKKIVGFLCFDCFLGVSPVMTKQLSANFFVIMQIKGPFVKAMLFNRTLLNINCPLLNQNGIGTFSDSM